MQKNFHGEYLFPHCKRGQFNTATAELKGLNLEKILMKKICWLKDSYKATWKIKKIQRKKSYQATKLLSYQSINVFQEKKSYRATELPSYWAHGTKKFPAAEKLPSYRHENYFFLPPAKMLSSYQATTSAKKFSRRKKLPSYQATKLPSYRRRNKFPAEKKLPGYWAELLSY